MKRLSVFGATGSIGRNTLDLVRRDRANYHIVALTGSQNLDCLVRDALEFRPDCVVVADDSQYLALKDRLRGCEIDVLGGTSGLLDAADRPVDLAMSAIVGAAGLEPGLRAMAAGADLALANKESMVAAGALVKKTALDNGISLIPVDSEHSAVFQALIGEARDAVERVILTASGGAFLDWSLEDIAKATPEQAATHPNWDMGQRITIDSASLFNKSLEVIEAKELFDLKPDQIEVLIHPQSMIHALVGFQDGALMAHIGPADMRHAIGFALHYPNRKYLPVDRLDLTQIGQFDFQKPDFDKYPALRLAFRVLEIGHLSGAVYNAAKEIALDAFIDRKIGFLDMARVVEAVLERNFASSVAHIDQHSLENVLMMDQMGRAHAKEAITKL
ncbi:MAG: 1-deoxy-D-xylulose-5-phosphate reductoisomerase [Paracoccaceae bacterium]